MVEGESDEKALPILIRKVITSSSGLKILGPFGNRLFDTDEMAKHIKVAGQLNHNINKVLLCVDSECTDIEETSEKLIPKQKFLRQTFPHLTLNYLIVDHSLEGWLLQDREALRQTLGQHPRLLNYGNPEQDCRPAKLLSEIYQVNGRDYKKTKDAPRLAEKLNIETVARTSQTFRDFQQALRD